MRDRVSVCAEHLGRFENLLHVVREACDVEIHMLLRARQKSTFAEEVGEHDVAHAKADTRDAVATELFGEAVVTSTACDGAHGFTLVEHFEHNAGVVGEAAHDRKVEVHAFAKACGGKRCKEVFDFLEGCGCVFALHGGAHFFDGLAAHEIVKLLDLCFREACFGKSLGKSFRTDFQATVKNRVNECRVRSANFFEVGGEELAARNANGKVRVLETEFAQHCCDGSEQVCFGVNAFGADDVHVQLEEFAEATLLSFFVTEQARHGEPLERLLEFAGLLDHEAGECRRHFGAERNFAVALVLEVVELAYDFFAGLAGVKFQMLKHRTFVFFVGEAFGDFAPGVKNIVLDALGFRVKITCALGQLRNSNTHSASKDRKVTSQ